MTLRELREFIRSVLIETVCPACGGRGASYSKERILRCPNKACKHFSLYQMRGEA